MYLSLLYGILVTDVCVYGQEDGDTMSYVDLNIHTEYSLLEGACRIADMVSYAKSLGKTALTLADTCNMFAAVRFYDECTAHGIKPIIGCEICVDGDRRISGALPRITLLCKDSEGYRSLCRLNTLSYADEAMPHISMKMLREHSKGLICLIGGEGSELYRLLSDRDDAAYSEAKAYLDIFGEDLYLHIDPVYDTSVYVQDALFRLSADLGIPAAAVCRTLYLRRTDQDIQRILSSIGDRPAAGRGHHLHTEEEMLALFPDHPEAVHNTALIADKCHFEMEYGHFHLPRYDLTPAQLDMCGGDSRVFFRRLCTAGLKKRYGTPSQELISRLDYELDVVTRMGYTDYYLIVWDFVSFAKAHGIPVGPGRGSGAGSLAAYCIGITDIDPIRYGLLFERFLNPERVSMPDFDIDFCYERRQEVIDYVVRRYGADRVAMIVTFGTLAAKAAVRDITRILGKPYAVGDRISRCIPSFVHISLDEALSSSEELRSYYESDADAREVIDTARYIEGMPRNTSTHAAGVVICDAPVSDYVPVIVRDGMAATQYTMTDLEKTGLLKMDFLGLRNLTVIHDCKEYVKQRCPSFDGNIPDDDAATYDMLSSGDTLGVFQFESAGMTELLRKFRPRSIEDLTAALSLYRPGPMDSIPRYLYNREHPDKVTYRHPCLEPILRLTYGCVVYQEQVMQICRVMAGYSYGRADLVRRAMSKKKADVMEKERPAFIEGAVNNGIDSRIAAEVFDELSGFASYAFNKSHAAAYSVVAYTTAYLKCHYRKEYMAALMSAFSGHQGKVSECMSYCRRHGIPILRPDINESGTGFTPCDEGIRFSLLCARNIGWNTVRDMTEERKKGRFTSLSDLAGRVQLSRRTAESLIKCGALDGMPHTRRTYLENLDGLLSSAGQFTRDRIEGQLDFFSSAGHTQTESLRELPEYPHEILLAQEHEILGMYVTGHPLDDALMYAAAAGIPDIQGMSRRAGDTVQFVCTLDSIKEHTAKSGELMAFAQTGDRYGTAEVVLFPAVYRDARPFLKPDARIFIRGRLSQRDRDMNVIADTVMTADEFMHSFDSGTLYIRVNSNDRASLDECTRILEGAQGTCKVLFVLEDLRKTIVHRRITSCTLSPKLLQDLSAHAALFLK